MSTQARRLLVTGGAGFIGSNFVRYWKEQNPNDYIAIVDSLTYAGNRHNINDLLTEQCQLFPIDICDYDSLVSLINTHKLNTIVHFAAESHVDRSIDGPDVFIQTNIHGTYQLLKAAKTCWLDKNDGSEPHHFHHVSTDEVYGTLSLQDDAFSETTPYAPNSPYAASKASSDMLVRSYHHTYGLNVTTSNCSNNYGPYHFPEKLIPLAITNVLRGLAIPVYGTGENIRDWLHVKDHAAGIELVIKQGTLGENYNIGGLNEWTNIDIIKLICSQLDELFSDNKTLKLRYPDCPASRGIACNSLVEFVTDRLGHDFRYAIDPKKIESELAYKPSTTFEQGLKSTLHWYLENQTWWEAVLDGSYRDTGPLTANNETT